MMDARIEAAERLLNKGVRFRLPARFFARLLKRDRLEVRPLCAGAILEIALVVMNNKLEEAIEKSDWPFLEQSIKPVARCVAIAVLGQKEAISYNFV